MPLWTLSICLKITFGLSGSDFALEQSSDGNLSIHDILKMDRECNLIDRASEGCRGFVGMHLYSWLFGAIFTIYRIIQLAWSNWGVSKCLVYQIHRNMLNRQIPGSCWMPYLFFALILLQCGILFSIGVVSFFS